MLLPWFNTLFKGELLVLIQPQRAVFLHLSRALKHGLKPQVQQKQTHALPYNFITEANQQQENLHVIGQLLSNEQWRGLATRVVLSNHFARFAVIPWNDALVAKEERQAFMLHCFAQAYGELAKSWNVSMSPPSFGENAIASAVSESLLQDLYRVFSECGLSLTGVHPHLMLAINQTLNETKKHGSPTNFWIVVIHAGHVGLVLHTDNQWRAVKNVALEVDISAQVSALIQREMINNNIEENLPKFLYWPESKFAQPMQLGGFEMIKVLPHPIDVQNSTAPLGTGNMVTV